MENFEFRDVLWMVIASVIAGWLVMIVFDFLVFRSGI